ncbi:hypothetical protein M432DRAFT_202853 [Thermoascus aurantiacus ATCC 26904]
MARLFQVVPGSLCAASPNRGSKPRGKKSKWCVAQAVLETGRRSAGRAGMAPGVHALSGSHAPSHFRRAGERMEKVRNEDVGRRLPKRVASLEIPLPCHVGARVQECGGGSCSCASLPAPSPVVHVDIVAPRSPRPQTTNPPRARSTADAGGAAWAARPRTETVELSVSWWHVPCHLNYWPAPFSTLAFDAFRSCTPEPQRAAPAETRQRAQQPSIPSPSSLRWPGPSFSLLSFPSCCSLRS